MPIQLPRPFAFEDRQTLFADLSGVGTPNADNLPSNATTYQLRMHLKRWMQGLSQARQFRDLCRTREQKRLQTYGQWQEGRVFFFDKQLQTEVESHRTQEPTYLQLHEYEVRHRYPKQAAAWDQISREANRLIPTLVHSLQARRMARAMPNLKEMILDLAADHGSMRKLAEVLAVVDDVSFLVLHLPSRQGFRVLAHGLESNFQLHYLLADALQTSPIGQQIPATDSDCVAIYKGQTLRPSGKIAASYFGMYRATGLKQDGTLASGWSGSDHWIWGEASPAGIPAVEGERVILLGAAPFETTWDVEKQFPDMPSELTCIETLSSNQVYDWFRRLQSR